MMGTDLRSSLGLAWRLLLRNLSAQYRQTLLGYVWAFLPPIATTFTFVMLSRNGVFNAGSMPVPYPLFVITGVLLWQTFVDALNSPLKLVETSKVMLAKINFPREALVLAAIGEVVFNLLIRLLLLAATLAWYRFIPPATFLLAPVGAGALIVLGIVLGLLITPLGVLYQDVSRGIALITAFWMFLTPVVYPPLASGGGWITRLNPVSPLLVATRDWMLLGSTTHGSSFLFVACIAFVCLGFGWLLFRLSLPHLIARLGG